MRMHRSCVYLAIASLALVATGPAWAATCHAPTWQTISDPIIGASFEMGSTPTRDYYLAWDEYPSLSIDEIVRPGPEIAGRCSTFSAAVLDYGAKGITDPEALLDKRQADAIEGLTNGRIVSTKKLRVSGYPAREYSYSFTIAYLGTPATHRVLEIVRGNQLLVFTSVWSDAGTPPADSDRSFASIRLFDAVQNPDIATLALLQQTILKYWLDTSPGDRDVGYLSPALRASFDPTRNRDSQVIDGFGYPNDLAVVRRSNGAKIVRVQHDNATVEWTVRDNGKQITALSWRKL